MALIGLSFAVAMGEATVDEGDGVEGCALD